MLNMIAISGNGFVLAYLRPYTNNTKCVNIIVG